MLHYTEQNIGTSTHSPLFLLHGFLESSTMWDHMVFPEDYPIVKVDLPGHGQSNHILADCATIEDMARAVMAVVDRLHVNEYHLIGHSMGGYIGLELKRMDVRLNKVMLLNSNFWTDSPQKVKDRRRVANIVQTNQSHFVYEVIPNLFVNPEEFDSQVKELIAEAMEMSPDAIARTSIAMSKREDTAHVLHENAEDFTIIQGIDDPIAQVGQMRELLEGVSVQYIELQGVGHMAHFEAKERLEKIIRTFLE